MVTYPNMMELFESLGIDMEPSDMSLSVSLNEGKGCEWGSRNGLSSLFAQKPNLFNPYFWQMLREILKFKNDVISYLELLENNPDIYRNETLGQFIKSKGYSELFQKAYLVPVCGSIWSCPTERVMEFSAFSILSFCRNHHLLQLFGRPQWMTVRWRSQHYVNKVREELKSRGCQIRTGCEVHSILSDAEGCTVLCGNDSQELYQGCIMAVHAPDALRLLGNQATYDESAVLGAFQYVYSDIYLHRDKNLMPKNPAAWSAWNFLGSTDKNVSLTYWLNVLQYKIMRTVLELPPTTGDVKIWEWECLLKLVSKNLGETSLPFLVTLNPDYTPQHTLLKWRTGHPVPSVAATKASLELDRIQGKRGIWFCGAYLGYGFHEDGLKAGMIAANGLLGKSCNILSNPKHMVPSLMETGARLFVTRFLSYFISTGCVILLEEGGTMFTFEGTSNKCSLKTVIKVHSPHFYWKVMTEADLGLADSYINGDFSFVDKKDGLLNLVMVRK
ncbi:tuberculostearic acid methyltransferase UfaA1-like [Gossypium australe]|uniref:Tuberculostearic acid methyltransferase UfaA1-like n=1 Tax=Gossypium australe TaxID=47621 RepID=A0A5B6WWU8_9ROSI|nr:tuberculostearic acid methyltransferase UfaA1-like [Gossypium australe]